MRPITEFKLIPKRVSLIILSASFALVAQGYLAVAISAFLPEIGLSSAEVGLIIGASGLTLGIVAIPFGILSDLKGRKWVLIGSAATLPLVFVIFSFTTDPRYLIIGAMLSGLAEATNLSAWNALIADQTTLKNRDRAFSLSFVINTSCFGLGAFIPFLFPTLEYELSVSSFEIHRIFFEACILLALITFIVQTLLLRNYHEVVPERDKIVTRRNFKLLAKIIGLFGLLGFGSGFIVPLVPTWFFFRFGAKDFFSGPIVAASNISIGLSAIISPRISRRFGPVRSATIVVCCSALVMLSLGFVNNVNLAAILYIMRSALMNISAPIVDSYIMGVVSRNERGVVSAVIDSVWRLPGSAGSIIGGLLLASGRYEIPFVIATVFYSLSMGVFYVGFRHLKPRS